MYLSNQIKEFLTDSEVDILTRHGDLLEGLAVGSIEPKTANQASFVEFCKGDFEKPKGTSQIVWKKYVALSWLIHDAGKSAKIQKEADEEIARLKSELSATESYVELLIDNLAIEDSYSWDAQAFEKLNEESKDALKKFEKLLVLHEKGLIEEKNYEKICKSTALWKAIHNYRKFTEPTTRRNFVMGSGPGAEICNACGVVVIDGHCRCSS